MPVAQKCSVVIVNSAGEANRLVAWLVKHSRNAEVMRAVVAHGATPHLVNMVNAEHAVMQNEALVALTLIATTILGERLIKLTVSFPWAQFSCNMLLWTQEDHETQMPHSPTCFVVLHRRPVEYKLMVFSRRV